MRSTGTAEDLEKRRVLALQRLNEGWTQVAVAAFLGVHKVTIAKWVAQYRQGGEEALAAKPTPGRPPFLTTAQEQLVFTWLHQKPTEHGFPTDLWTAKRVAVLIARRLAIQFHPNYLREWLSQRGWTPQKPIRRPRQRNQQVIDEWLKQTWPRLQKRRKRSTPPWY